MKKNIYYHFLSAENAIKDLNKSRIKVSTLDTLNDPFEFMPYRRYRNFNERQRYNRVFRAVSKKWGILCFSQTWTEQLFWAHYADKHKGIALGFEIPKNKILKVKYDCSEIRTKFDLTGNQAEDERKFLDLGEVKFQEWSYEKEFRLLINFSNSNCISEDKMYFLPFGNELKLKEIVLGCRFYHATLKKIIIDFARKYSVEVIATREGWEDYRVHKCGTKTGRYKKS